VEVVETLGPVNQIHVSLLDPLAPVEKIVSFIATLDTTVKATPGQELELSVNPQRLHFFHLDNGQII
jgi:ABC-type sugar transport system ATPase subunit